MCNSSFAPQQSFAPTSVCSQTIENTTLLAAVFGTVESVLLVLVAVKAVRDPVAFILPILAVATALIDDIVVYTQWRHSVPSQVLLVAWTCLVTATSKTGIVLAIPPLIALPVAIVTDVTRGALIYVFVAFFASKFWEKKLHPFAEILFVGTAILCTDLVTASETGGDNAEVVLSTLKFLVGALILWNPRKS